MYRKESFIKFKNYNDNAGVKPKDYLIAIDSSCNLCRHSCRTSYIVESYDMVKSKEKNEYHTVLTEELISSECVNWSFMASYVGVVTKNSIFIKGVSLY